MEIKASSRSLRRDLGDILTLAMITSARVAVQECEEGLRQPADGWPPDVERLKKFTNSPAYQHALKAYVDGTITLQDLARALEPLRPMLPWLVNTI